MPASHSDQLVEFISGCQYNDIPEPIRDYTKLVLLDCIICGIAAGSLQRSKMIAGVYTQLGGNQESTIFGSQDKFPAPHAAAANAEIMNLLDADDTFFTSSHFAAFSAASVLAEAGRTDCSGNDIVRAMALGFDVNARLFLSQISIIKSERGKFEYSPVQGMGFAAFGTAVASAALRKMPQAQLRNLLGVTGWMAPTPTCNPQADKTEHHSFKYANYSAAALAGMLAVHYTEAGYAAQDDILDSGAFMRSQGCLDTDLDLLTDELGSKWWIEDSCIKYYPSCRYTSAPIDMLLELMQSENLAANDIESIDIEMNSVAYAMTMFNNPATTIAPDHKSPLNGAFNIPYVMSLAALGYKPGPNWYSEEYLQNQAVWDFAKKITTSESEGSIAEITRALTESKIRRFRKSPSAMTVLAGGKEYKLNADYAQGDPWQSSTAASWESINTKFENFCGDIIGAAEIQRITDRVRNLDDVDSIGQII